MTVSRVALIGSLAVGLLVAPLTAEAQPSKVPRIGALAGAFPTMNLASKRFDAASASSDTSRGQTHVLEVRYAEGSDLFPSLAADLVRLKPDLIVSVIGPGAAAEKEATTSIPIVLASSLYPVELGVIASLAHPGGNVTGVTHFTPELMAKRVQLLKEVVPNASRMAVLRLPGRVHDLIVRDMQAAAQRFGIKLQVIEVQRAEDLSAAFDVAAVRHAQAVLTTQGPLFFFYRVQIVLRARSSP